MRPGCCLGSALLLAGSLLLTGCETPTTTAVGVPVGGLAQPAEPAPREAVPEGLTPNEAVRLQYRRMRAKELVQEAKILQRKQRYAEASAKMAEAQKLLEGLPEQ